MWLVVPGAEMIQGHHLSETCASVGNLQSFVHTVGGATGVIDRSLTRCLSVWRSVCLNLESEVPTSHTFNMSFFLCTWTTCTRSAHALHTSAPHAVRALQHMFASSEGLKILLPVSRSRASTTAPRTARRRGAMTPTQR